MMQWIIWSIDKTHSIEAPNKHHIHPTIGQESKVNVALVQIYYYPSFSIAFSCIWSICSWEISSNKLHQSLPLIIKLNFWSSGCTHLPFVRMSAFIGSEGENHLHDKQFSYCHDTLFKLFVASVIFSISLLCGESQS